MTSRRIEEARRATERNFSRAPWAQDKRTTEAVVRTITAEAICAAAENPEGEPMERYALAAGLTWNGRRWVTSDEPLDRRLAALHGIEDAYENDGVPGPVAGPPAE